MLYGRQRVRPGEAVITCKIAADKWSLDRRGQNPGLQPHWPGGAEKTNLWLVDGEVVIARKNVRSTANARVGLNHVPGFTALNGETIAYDPEVYMRDHKVLGIMATTIEFGGDTYKVQLSFESNGIGIQWDWNLCSHNNTLG